MFFPGLVSVSFRSASTQTIVNAAQKAGLQFIEWGGDVHVPAGDISTAKEVRRQTINAGLQVSSYGSYFRLGCSGNIQREFTKILETTQALKAPIVRIWGCNKGSAEIDKELFKRLADEAKFIADMAKAVGINVSLECHNDTITDDYNSAIRFLKAVDRPNFSTYWQPNQLKSEDYNKKSATVLAPYTTNIHVFHWDANKRYPLYEGKTIWKSYLDIFKGSQKNHVLLLEFMHDDNLSSLKDTAKTLLSWISRQS